MKRKQVDNNASHAGRGRLKRAKTHCADASAPRPSPPETRASTQTPAHALTQECLRNLQESTAEVGKLSISHWRSCVSTGHLENMDAPPTPRSAGERRHSKHRRHAQKLRTPSPSKRPTPQTYRTRNMHHARVLVDTSVDLPPAISTRVRDILGVDGSGHPVATPEDASPVPALVAASATMYWKESQRNARECSLEGDWKASLYGLVRMISNVWPGDVKVHTSEKIWHSDLKPTGPSFEESVNENRSTMPDYHTPQTALPESTSSEAATSDSTFLGSVPSLPPPSVAPTTSTEAASPYHISTPKPDITVGLAHGKFMPSHQQRLVNHQVSGTLLSDPHVADMGIRFPFLVAEVKGLSLNGSLVSAQNQAAISGASMLTILQNLMSQARRHSSSDADSELRLYTDNTLCFSIVTAGPLHEIWVNFTAEGAYHMECLQALRTTLERDALHFSYCVYRILNWGQGTLRDAIVEKVERI